MCDEDPWDYAVDKDGHAIIPGAEDEPDSVFPDPAFDPELWPLPPAPADELAAQTTRLAKAIRATWPAEGPWNAGRAAAVMLAEGYIPVPAGLTPDALELFGKTHVLMCDASREIRNLVGDEDIDQLTVWQLLLRAGVCERLISAPGERSETKIINAMRGERKAWPTRRREVLWQQVSYPAGLAEATLAMLERVSLVELRRYQDELQRLLPTLRRCKKKSQERRKK